MKTGDLLVTTADIAWLRESTCTDSLKTILDFRSLLIYVGQETVQGPRDHQFPEFYDFVELPEFYEVVSQGGVRGFIRSNCVVLAPDKVRMVQK